MMRIVDTHCHLIYLDRLSYPWLAETPPLNRNFPLTDYWPQAKAAGITDVIHMEVDVAPGDMEAETDLIAGLGKPVVALIASCRPEDDGFADYVERTAGEAKVKGFRRILHTQDDELGKRPIFAENLKLLSRHNLSFDLCVLPRQLPVATALAAACARRPVHRRSLRRPERQGSRTRSVAGEHARAGGNAERRVQDFGNRRLRRSGQLGGRRPQAVLRALHRNRSAGIAWCGGATGRSAR